MVPDAGHMELLSSTNEMESTVDSEFYNVDWATLSRSWSRMRGTWNYWVPSMRWNPQLIQNFIMLIGQHYKWYWDHGPASGTRELLESRIRGEPRVYRGWDVFIETPSIMRSWFRFWNTWDIGFDRFERNPESIWIWGVWMETPSIRRSWFRFWNTWDIRFDGFERNPESTLWFGYFIGTLGSGS